MSIRKYEFNNGDVFHVYNRGNNKRKIFLDKDDLERFLFILEDFNDDDSVGGIYRKKLRAKKIEKIRKSGGKASTKLNFDEEREPLVKIVAYCLNPNHYHLILEQLVDDGISKFMQKVGTGYTMYFNRKHNKNGSLFQGKFKAALAEDGDSIIRLSVYVNLNYKVHKIQYTEKNGGKASTFVSSWDEYTKTEKQSKGKKQKKNKGLCEGKDLILKEFGNNKKRYKEFAKNRVQEIVYERQEQKELDFYLKSEDLKS